ncbi:hypothetical protein [Antiquaquibacter soli]|uniref:Uncharacterized protein n=1 Tax=Antiquaquibacter soli TaxID=3064523 RepID=A0ABT9BTY0_9MICO|nr:hypothetical protein [Protaetiibacter sp. WY-16]MDO7883256.1 hypothetical protein [Protaetiibacter sp. WY-16]
MSRTAVYIGIGLTVVAAIRLATDPSSLHLGALVVIALVTLVAVVGVVLQARSRLAGADARREAMTRDGLNWVADVRIDREVLERIVGPVADPPATVALGAFDGEVEVWLDATGSAGVLPEGRATAVQHPRNPDAPWGVLVEAADAPIPFDVVGALWGAVPVTEARTREVVVVLNGPVSPGRP